MAVQDCRPPITSRSRQAGRMIRSGVHRHKLKPYRAAAKAERKSIAANAAGLQAAHHQQEHKAHAADDQRPFPVPGGKGRGLSAFLCGFLGCGSRGLGGVCRPLSCHAL